MKGTDEQEAVDAERRVPAVAAPPRADPAAAHELDGVRLHRDAGAAAVTDALGTTAVTAGDQVFLSPRAPAVENREGRRLLAHELTHVLQQRAHGPRVQRFETSERPRIARDLAAMMVVVETLVSASSTGEQVVMDRLVRNVGGHTAGEALPPGLRSDGPAAANLLPLRYLMTRRAGLVDLRHFVQELYVAWFLDIGGQPRSANRAATRRGVEYEESHEATSRYAPEDLTSNALGAWTATRLAGFPQRPDVVARIRETLERCAPLDFDALSAASQTSVVDFYAARTGSGEPLNQNRTALALVPAVPELAGQDRSFPFELDEDDPRRATLAGPAYDGGAAGLTGDTEIRAFVATQREQVVRDVPAAVRGRLGARLLEGWVSDDDLAALARLHRLADPPGKAALRAAASGITLSSHGQRIRLKLLLEEP